MSDFGVTSRKGQAGCSGTKRPTVRYPSPPHQPSHSLPSQHFKLGWTSADNRYYRRDRIKWTLTPHTHSIHCICRTLLSDIFLKFTIINLLEMDGRSQGKDNQLSIIITVGRLRKLIVPPQEAIASEACLILEARYLGLEAANLSIKTSGVHVLFFYTPAYISVL